MLQSLPVVRLLYAALFLFQLVCGDFSPDITVSTISKDIFQNILYFDDSSNMIALDGKALHASYDDGASWNVVKGMEDAEVDYVEFDPNVKERAFAFTGKAKQYVTNDKGKTWLSFLWKTTKGQDLGDARLSFHADDKNLVILDFTTCEWGNGPEDQEVCRSVHLYTTDGFKTDPKVLTTDADSCKFARSSKSFLLQGSPQTIFCTRNHFNSFGHVVDTTLVKTDNFFKTETVVDHPDFRSGKILDLRVDESFMLVLVQKDKFNKKSQVSLVVSKNGELFHLSDFSVEVAYGSILFLDSSRLSIFMAVTEVQSGASYAVSSLYSSDSTGLRFTKLIEDTLPGSTVKVQNVDGVWFTNEVGAADMDKPSGNLLDVLFGGQTNRKLTSKVSINDGKDWHLLEVIDDDSCKISDGCSLHILDPTIADGEGKYITGLTADIVMAVGNTGKQLGNYRKMKTFISRDGGVTWKEAIKEATVFSYGDQGNIIVAVPFNGKSGAASKHFFYSLDQGKTWVENKLEKSIYPMFLSTTVDGSGAKFLLTGFSGRTDLSTPNEVIYSMDFTKAFDGKKCGDDDFEKVMARISPDNQTPVCVYGHRESFRRRKQDAKCLVKTLFEDVKVTEDPCECTESDFECSPYFKLSDKGACVPDKPLIDVLCKTKSGGKSMKLPDKQLIDENKCSLGKKKISDFVTEFDLQCSEMSTGEDGKILAKLNEIGGELKQYSYVSTDSMTENLLVQTSNNLMYASNNGGISFKRIPVPEEIPMFFVGPVPGTVILLTKTEVFYYSTDGGNTFLKGEAPAPPAWGVLPVSFHPTEPLSFIWISGDGCDSTNNPGCKLAAHYTDDGENFSKMVSGVVGCNFVSQAFQLKTKEMIYCTAVDGNKRKLISSTNYFKESTPAVLFDSIIAYAVKDRFVIVATIEESLHELRAKVTVDGVTFADADFPRDFKVEAQTAYTILDSGSSSVFMHVTTDRREGHERGAILKSNSNGTSYVLSLNNVNRNLRGYVDYDRIDSLEGVLIANTVNNPDSSDRKQLKTQISFNDGSEWAFLAPPAVDSTGKKYACAGSSLAKCSLNLHGFTERPDYRDTFSSASAVGLLIGVGNVGETLLPYNEASTFMSSDGGLTWKEITKGVYMWEFGDRGTILVLVEAKDETDTLLYSTNDGADWKKFRFANQKVRVIDLATVPTDTARKFVIFASDGKSDVRAYSIDFTNFFDRQCQLDLEHPDKDDYEFWSPKHPQSSESCLFGHEAKYLRRAIGHNDCFIGSAPLLAGFKVIRNCTCTRNDYECDYNYFRDTDGTCKLVKGLTPADRKTEMCSKPDTFQYFEPTGYRKIPLSTCVGGKGFDSWNAQPCPGHQKEFDEHNGREVGGGKIALLVLIPLFVFIFATWFVYDRGIRRNGGFKRFGQIRLDEEDEDLELIEDNNVDLVVNKIIRGGIVVVAGAVATVKTIRKVDRALFDRLTSVLFGRNPGRRNYVSVPDDEDELFGTFEDNYEDDLGDANEVDFEVEEEPEEFTDLLDVPAADARLFDIDDASEDESRAHPVLLNEETSP